VERWRERLLADAGAIDALAGEFPHGNIQAVRALLASVRRDQAAGRPPKQFRALFRALRTIINPTEERGIDHAGD
jgi:ribosome-associated protein